jgi:hypothetical protein
MNVEQRKTNPSEPVPEMPGKLLVPLAPAAWRVLLLLGGICVMVHLALYNRFGYHLDELYFMECGWHLALGYVDHPPLVPWIARLGMALFGENLFAVRFFPAMAAGAAVVMTGLITRELGGARYAQGIAGLAVLMVPAYLRSGGLLCIPIFELLFWTGFSYSVARALNQRDSRWWIAAGVTAGLGLLTKYTMAVWGTAVVAGILLTPARRRLLSPWPWVGAVLAGGVFFPHMLWEATHGWPTVEFLQNLRVEILEYQSRLLFIFHQLVNMHFLLTPVWALGLWYFFSPSGRRFRVFGWAFAFAFGFFFLEQGKAYYLAPAYPVLFAGGGLQLERILSCDSSAVYRRIVAAAIVIVGVANALFALPVIPLEMSDRITGTVFGYFVDPTELTREFHSQYGWEGYAEKVAEAYRMLEPEEQQVCTILALKYSQASAINLFGKSSGLPRAVSGHMNYYLWGPVPGRGEVAIACGFPLEMLRPLYGDIREVGRTFHPLARHEYNNVPIYVCRDPEVDLASAWLRLKRYYHTAREWQDKPATR